MNSLTSFTLFTLSIHGLLRHKADNMSMKITLWCVSYINDKDSVMITKNANPKLNVTPDRKYCPIYVFKTWFVVLASKTW